MWFSGRMDVKYQVAFHEWMLRLQKHQLDIYDVASLMYLKRRLLITEEMEDARHIVVDEAQDYGVIVFWVLKQILPRCTFTVMGDVSQNINYDSGMNDWEALKTEVFHGERDYFSILAKSYFVLSRYFAFECELCRAVDRELSKIILIEDEDII